MAYPRKARNEDVNAEYRENPPDLPEVPEISAPSVPNISGGAPRVAGDTARGLASFKRSFNMIGLPDAVPNRYIAGVPPAEAVAKTLRRYWQQTEPSGGGLIVPAVMPLKEAETYLAGLKQQLRLVFDERAKNLPPEEARSYFWRTYRQYPDQMATLVARRILTDKLIASGPVARWLSWLKG